MPAQRKTNQSRRLTASGLIAVATRLMMAWAVLPSASLAGAGTQADPTATTVPTFATRLREAVRSAA